MFRSTPGLAGVYSYFCTRRVILIDTYWTACFRTSSVPDWIAIRPPKKYFFELRIPSAVVTCAGKRFSPNTFPTTAPFLSRMVPPSLRSPTLSLQVTCFTLNCFGWVGFNRFFSAFGETKNIEQMCNERENPYLPCIPQYPSGWTPRR